MPGKRGHRRKALKLKLKKNTVYTIFGVGFLMTATLLILAYFQQDESSLRVISVLHEKFGSLSFLLPIALIFVGFLFLRLRFYLSQLNVSIGFILLFVCLVGLTRSGTIGAQIYQILEEILTRPAANLVFIG